MLEQVINIITRFTWRDILDIVIVSYVFYKVILLIRGTRAEQLIKGLAVILIATLLSGQLGLNSINWLLRQLMTVGLIAIPVVFQPELRRGLEQIGRGKLFTRSNFLYKDTKDFEYMFQELIKAIKVLVKKKIGALIVIERETGLNDIIETGIKIDGRISAELLVNIFIPRSPLHDGAIILRGSQVVAAGCFLPLTENPGLSKELGTRHRAALGITEQSDAAAVIISEETGVISLALDGKLTRYLDEKSLKQMLAGLFESENSIFQFQLFQWRS